jgi:hypothetical protein
MSGGPLSVGIGSWASRRRSSSRIRVSSRTALQAALRSALARSRRSAEVKTSSAMRNSVISGALVGSASRTIAESNHASRTSSATAGQPSGPSGHVGQLASPASSTIGCAASSDTRVPSGVTRVPRASRRAHWVPRVGRQTGVREPNVRHADASPTGDTSDPSCPHPRQHYLALAAQAARDELQRGGERKAPSRQQATNCSSPCPGWAPTSSASAARTAPRRTGRSPQISAVDGSLHGFVPPATA